MFDVKKVEIEWGGKTLSLETGRVARQADGAVLATYGETVVLCAVTAAKSVKEGQDFFPLTVHYQEKFSAAGRIPGGFFKRERGATEKETLTSRLRSEEQTSELKSLMRHSYAVFCLKKKKNYKHITVNIPHHIKDEETNHTKQTKNQKHSQIYTVHSTQHQTQHPIN